jgi:hypothetical protein
VVEQEGRTLNLEIRKAKVVSSGSAAAMVPPVVQPMPGNMNPAVVQSVVPNPTPADEQKRLEAVAQEVARRRALREQATNQLQAMPAPAVIPPAQQPAAAQPPAQNNNNAGRRGPIPNRQQR